MTEAEQNLKVLEKEIEIENAKDLLEQLEDELETLWQEDLEEEEK